MNEDFPLRNCPPVSTTEISRFGQRGMVRGNEISRFNWHSSVRLEGGIEGIEVLSFVSIVHEILKKERDSWEDYLFCYYILSESHGINVYEWKSRATDDGISFMVDIVASVTTADIVFDKMFRIIALWFKFVWLFHQANRLKKKIIGIRVT